MHKLKGFTLIELLVATGLFVVVISIVSASFIQALRAQRSITALMEANDNVSLVLEQIAREIRTGYRFCTKDYPIPTTIADNPDIPVNYCSGLGDDELVFVNANNQVVWYKFENEAIWKGTEDIFLGRDYKKITADNVKINYFNIILSGNDSKDGLQPRITISLSISPTGRDIKDVKTNIQTTISARLIDD
ncbi:MAG: type II secretion system protein [Candidatus Paceibacterota bacterium]